jgi:hypothetical protein
MEGAERETKDGEACGTLVQAPAQRVESDANWGRAHVLLLHSRCDLHCPQLGLGLRKYDPTAHERGATYEAMTPAGGTLCMHPDIQVRTSSMTPSIFSISRLYRLALFSAASASAFTDDTKACGRPHNGTRGREPSDKSWHRTYSALSLDSCLHSYTTHTLHLPAHRPSPSAAPGPLLLRRHTSFPAPPPSA